ncbi:MAG: beta-1,6-N-acetylglucosaminyltransferase [Lactobacillus sp.]
MQAVLIVAHKNIEQMIKLANLLSRKFAVYVHIDKEYHLSRDEEAQLAKNHIRYISEVAVHWGSWSIGEAALRLMKWAMANPKITYVHLISGQDWPAQNLNDIYDFYEHNDRIYMTYKLSKTVRKAYEPVILWQQYYFNYDQFPRRTFIGKFYHRFLLLAESILRVNKFKRLGVNVDIYNGANWVDIPRDALAFAIKYMAEHPKFKHVFETGFCSDEFWLQTILVNQPQFKARIVNDNHRYVKWVKQHGSFPAILDQNDFDLIPKTAQFIRKIEPRYSNQLIQQLNQRDHN